MKKFLGILVVVCVLGIGAWLIASKTNVLVSLQTPGGDIESITGVTEGPIGLANPASVFCEEHGGVLDTIEGTGGQYSLCHLPSGEVCEERAYFRGECGTEGNPCDEDAPVCALVHVQCVTTPCDPIEQTFPNLCQMKANPLAVFLHDGACVTK